MQYQKTIKTKNGLDCLLRGAAADDAEAVIEIFQATHAETDFLLTYPDENKLTLEGEREFLAGHAASANAIEILAIIDGQIVGSAGFAPVGDKEKLRHRAEFGVSVRKAFWGLGIGRALTEACIECAKAAGYKQIELDAVADNKAALALYRSVGFVEYGRNPLGFRSRLTGWQELVYMRLEL